MARPSLGLQASSRRYLIRRLERALVLGSAHRDSNSARAPSFSVTAGVGLTLAGLLGCVALGYVRPSEVLGDEDFVMDRKTGALYVRIDDVVHPVLNLTSARLIAERADLPRPVAESALASTKRGALLGIPGAPASLGTPLPDVESRWTVCDGSRTTVIAGPVPDTEGANQPLLVTGPTGTAYLLYDGRRAALSPTNPAVARALRLDGVEPKAVSAAFLNTIPEASPVAVPKIPGLGGPAPEPLAGFRVGDIVRVESPGTTEHFVVLDGGVQRIGPVTADLIRFAGATSAPGIPAVAAAVISAVPTLGVLPVDSYPDQPVARGLQKDENLCAHWVSGAVTFSAAPTPPVAAGHAPVKLAQADGAGPAVDEVLVPPGRSLYVRPEGEAALTGSVVTDTGVRFAVGDAEAARVLALPATAVPAPWALLSALPAGPMLSRDAALVARDVVPAAGSAQSGER